MESTFARYPCDHSEIRRRCRPEARDEEFDRPIRILFINAHRLDLKSNNSAVIQVPHSELHGFQVRKRAEQIQMLSLGELADHLRLTQKAQWATLQLTSLLGNRNGRQAERHAEFLHQTI